MERDRNLLFGVLAIQLKQISPRQLVEAAAAWATDPSRDLSERLVEAGVLTERDRNLIEDFVSRAVDAHEGDAHATLTRFGGEEQVQRSFRGCIQIEENGGVAVVPPTPFPVDVSDIDRVPAVEEAPGRYTVTDEYARGGMGRILLAVDKHFDREVALKELVPDPKMDGSSGYRLSAAHIARFLQEGRITGQLEHPSIVPVYEIGRREDGTLYYTMKFVRGKSLAQAIAEAGSIEKRLALLPHFVDVCQAMAYAHSRGIIHRDIKPGNVMLGEFGETVLLDWGIAKAKNRRDIHASGLTEALREINRDTPHPAAIDTAYGETLGTPAYMPPEQARGELDQVDERSDIYGLGALLYELLTGHAPFEGGSIYSVVWRVMTEEPPRVMSLERKVPPELVAICERAMQKDRTKRYESAKVLAEEVERFQSGALVQSYEYKYRELFRRFIQRHKAILTTAALAACVLIAGGAMSYVRVVSERDRALEATEKEVVARLAEQTAREESEKAREEERLARQAAELASYNANVRLSNEYIHDGQYNSAQQTLWRAPAGLRDWEWGYLLELCNQDLFTFAGHEDRIADLALSPDGTRFVTASWDNTARIWDLASGTQAASLDAHEDGVTCAAFSLDGTRIVTGSFDSSASVWDASTGAEIAVLSGHDGAVNSAAFSPDGLRVVTASPDKTARVWDAQSGAQLAVLPEQEDNVGQALFSPDGTRILTVTWRGNVSLWDAASYGHVLSLADPEARCFEAAFSPDGTRILTIFLDTMSETAKVWDAATGQEHTALIGHEDRVLRAVFSPDGRRIATASSDKTARIWDAATGRMLASLKGHDEAVIEIAFSPDGRRIVTGSRDKTAKVWDAGSGELIETLVGHNDWVVCAVFTPDGRRVITASADGTAKLWEPKSGADKQTPSLAIPSVSVLSIDFSADGARIAAALSNGAVRVWDTATLSESVSFASFGEHCRGDISPDGTRVAAAFNEPGYGANVWIWDIATRKIAAALDGQVGTVNDIAFSPDGTRVVTASDNLSAKVWDAATGAESMALSSHAKTVFRAAWSPDGKQIVTASSDDAARIWDAETGAETATIPSDRWLDHVSFSPGGRNLLTTTDEFALLWNWASSEVSAALDGEVNGMSRAPFNPKGTRIAGVAGGRAKVWNAVTGSELLTLPGVNHAVFHPDEIRLMTVAPDNAVRFLRAAPFREDMLPGDASMDWEARYEIYRRERLAQERPKAERREAPFDIVAATRAEVNERLAQLSRIYAADAANTPPDAVITEEPAPGFLVSEGPAGDALARLCLRKDDVVFAVNGTPVSDVATALGAFAAFLDAQKNDAGTPLTVAVLRDGQPRELRFMFLDSMTSHKKVSFPRETFAGLLAVQLPLALNNADLIAERDQRQAKWHREPAIEGEPAGFWIDETYNSIVDNFIQQLGLQPGDRILAIGGTPVRSGHELLDAAQRVQQAIAGGTMDSLSVEVRRGQFRSLTIDLQFE